MEWGTVASDGRIKDSGHLGQVYLLAQFGFCHTPFLQKEIASPNNLLLCSSVGQHCDYFWPTQRVLVHFSAVRSGSLQLPVAPIPAPEYFTALSSIRPCTHVYRLSTTCTHKVNFKRTLMLKTKKYHFCNARWPMWDNSDTSLICRWH